MKHKKNLQYSRIVRDCCFHYYIIPIEFERDFEVWDDEPPTNEYANILFAYEYVKEKIWKKLDELFPSYVLDTWEDPYDNSLEIGFSDRTPKDICGDERLRDLIKEWGFGMVYLNFTDNTQQIIYANGTHMGKRYDYGWNNASRWNKEKADELE